MNYRIKTKFQSNQQPVGYCLQSYKRTLSQIRDWRHDTKTANFLSALLIVAAIVLSVLASSGKEAVQIYQANELLCVPSPLELIEAERQMSSTDRAGDEPALFQTGGMKQFAGQGVSVTSGRELIDLLKDANLWDMEGQYEISPVLVVGFPADLGQFDVDQKKRAFIHSLLPVVMVVQDEIRQERFQLLSILDQIGGEHHNLMFTADLTGWQDGLEYGEVQFVRELTGKYRTQSVAELLRRVDVVPASLVIAQGAIESSWGGSRFAREANNIFGMWTWAQKGIVPNRREEGKTHKIAVYDSIIDSVRAYVLTLNRLQAYEELRQIRSRTLDPFQISEGLTNYSARGEYYISDIKRIIEANNLMGYDRFRLAAS